MKRVLWLWLGVVVALACPGAAAATAWDAIDLAGAPAAAACDGGFARVAPIGVDGLFVARLGGSATGPDWDLRLLAARSGAERDASKAFGAAERVSAPVLPGDRVRVEVCPGAGVAGSPPSLTLREAVPDGPVKAIEQSLVRIRIGGQPDIDALARLGIDLNEAPDGDHIDAVLHGPADAEALRAAGYDYSVRIEDLRAFDARALATRATPSRALPSGRTTYRKLSDYQAELKDLVTKHPGLVRPVVLGTSVLGVSIEGVEIATGVNRTDDGRPVHVEMGLHHAREWSSGEVVMEWARELADDPGARFAALRDNSRTFLFPVINPDGFSDSIQYGYNPTDDSYEGTLAAAVAGTGSYRRKNCRGATIACGPQGVDLNRNYGAYWGGPGNSDSPAMQTYRGPAPFSEPEASAVHAFSSAHQIMLLNSNHNYAGDVLYQPGFNDADEPGLKKTDKVPYQDEMKAVAANMATAAGYVAFPSYDLYDVTGATEDWNYFAQGAFGYTVEVGYDNFHPNYQDAVIDQYTGSVDGSLDKAAGRTPSKGLRESLLIAGEAVLNPAYHSIIRGSAPAGRRLRITKSFMLPTSYVITNTETTADEGAELLLPEKLESTLTVPPSGSYEWHVNPSTRPTELIAGRTEAWTMTCESADGATVYDTRQVTVGLGQATTQDFACGATAATPTATASATAVPTASTSPTPGATGTPAPTATATPTADPPSLSVVRAVRKGRRLVVTVQPARTGPLTQIKATLRRSGRQVASKTRARAAGARFTIVLRPKRLPLGAYRITVSAQTADGPLTATARLQIRRRT